MFSIINWYTQRFPFPARGWKLFSPLLKLFHIYHRFFIKKLHNGLLMYVRPSEHIQQQIFWHGYYEKEVIRLWETSIPAGAVVADIGANAGYYSLIASPRSKQVYAFEPASSARAELEKNSQLNKLSNISIQPFALGKMPGEAQLYLSDAGNSGMSSLQSPGNFSGSTEKVMIMNFDEWAIQHQVGRLDCIKIDVEGAEMNVLEGMGNSLQKFRPVIFIEVIDELLKKFGHGKEDIYRLLFSYGYKAYEVGGAEILSPKEDTVVIFR